jgi:tripartite-type tricarboxylate transporter receptor subunit TctC
VLNETSPSQISASRPGAAALPAVSRIAWAQAYPSRPVRIIVGLPAGTATDILARLVGQSLSERLGKQFIVENRPGAGGNLATEAVVRAPADGYTLLQVNSGNAVNASLYANLNFNFIRDITPVACIARTPFVMVVNPSSPAKTVPEFIAYAKANPGKINMASPGTGSANHIFGASFAMMAGIDLVHVPYRGDFMADLLGGRVQVLFSAMAQSIEYIRDGKLRGLAVTTAARLDVLPDIPAMDEFVTAYEASGWQGFGAPKNTPTNIVDRLNNEINAIVADPQMKVRLLDMGFKPTFMTSAGFGKFIADETEKWAKVVKFAGIKLE